VQTTDFDFNLPKELIAQYPTPNRTESRLLHVNRQNGEVEHHQFSDIINFLEPGDLLVLNNSRVIPARVFGQKASGAKIEVLIERLLSNNEALAHIGSNKKLKPGSRLLLSEALTEFDLLEQQDALFKIRLLSDRPLLDWLYQYGHMPLPPYMTRKDDANDQERYQTVYAETAGSVAAPTAGLHFDTLLLEKIKAKDIDIRTVTLHVGAGTFQPVRVDNILEHRMHYEWLSVPQETCDAIIACKKRGKRVIAVGTTSTRSLETAARHSSSPHLIEAYQGESNLFLYPGQPFYVIDGLITNFHLPKSTLFMLVSAFASREIMLNAYQKAIESQYRFFSYGDAMIIC
jgi:S-adenosylmethionine:tRNA ribosyltransferase-isomerase